MLVLLPFSLSLSPSLYPMNRSTMGAHHQQQQQQQQQHQYNSSTNFNNGAPPPPPAVLEVHHCLWDDCQRVAPDAESLYLHLCNELVTSSSLVHHRRVLSRLPLKLTLLSLFLLHLPSRPFRPPLPFLGCFSLSPNLLQTHQQSSSNSSSSLHRYSPVRTATPSQHSSSFPSLPSSPPVTSDENLLKTSA